MLHWNLLVGPLPAMLLLLSLPAGLYLLLRPALRRWWTVAVPLVVVGAIGGALLIDWYVNDVWQAFTDPLPTRVVFWFGVILGTVALMVLALIKGTWRQRLLSVLAAVLVVATGLNGINQMYDYYPTLADAFGVSPVHRIALPPIEASRPPATTDGSTSSPPGTTGEQPGGTVPTTGTTSRPTGGLSGWRPDGPLPATGALSEVTIPATVSKFWPRPAWVYLPPAYLVKPRPNLPVLILIPGQFSNTNNWIMSGHLVSTMDAFAAKHHGLAPIVVMPDALGTTTGKEMCLDSRLGHVDTYLSVDVVNWIRTHLQADPDTAHWAVGGFSYGGSCSLELAVAHPRLFPTILDISGEITPTLGNTQRTVANAFGGDLAAYQRVQPLRILAAGLRDPRTAANWAGVDGTFAVGSQDVKYTAERATVVRECRKAGIAVHELTIPGGHSWFVATAALIKALPHLAARMGLT